MEILLHNACSTSMADFLPIAKYLVYGTISAHSMRDGHYGNS